MKLNISKLYNENKNFITKQFLLAFIIGLIVYLINSIKQDFLPGLLISFLFANPLITYCHRFYTPNDIDVDFNINFYTKAVVAGIIHTLLITFGLLFLIVPGIYLIYKFRFYHFILLENYNELSVIEILKQAYHYDYYPISQLFLLDLWFIIPLCIFSRVDIIAIAIVALENLFFGVLYVSHTDDVVEIIE